MIERSNPNPTGGRAWIALLLITLANVGIYAVAALLHWGAQIALGPITLAFPEAIPAASIVEGTIAAVLTAGLASWIGRPAGRGIWLAYGVALIGTIFGLTIALLRGLPGPDIWVHVLMLIGLACWFGLLFAIRRARQPSAGHS